ncbi:MAG: nuclear transport factor 2 family protein [Thermoleophilaceae bacterium]
MNEREVLSVYAEAKGRRDVAAALAVCTDDCTYSSAGFGAPVRGKEALRAFYGALFEALPDYFGDFDAVVHDAGGAVAWGRWGGTVCGDFMGLGARPGARIDVPVAFVCTFRDGLLASDTGYFDVATLCSQAGIPLAALQPRSGAEFVERFVSFWRAPDPALIPSLVHPDVRARFVGVVDDVVGVEAYRAQIAAALAVAPDLRLEVVGGFSEGERVLIEWHACCSAGGRPVEFEGMDRLVVRDGLVVDARVTYDTGPLRDALAAAGAPGTARAPGTAGAPAEPAAAEPAGQPTAP